MKYQAVDIELKEFQKVFRGYDQEEVRRFLKEISSQFEVLMYENNVLKDRLREREVQIAEFKEREETLKTTVVTAQKITESMTEQANKEALQIVSTAKLKAESMIKDARRRVRGYIDDIARLEQKKSAILTELKSLLETQLKLIAKYEGKTFDTADVELAIDEQTKQVN